jgi:uncharacterized membrane protein YgcG
MRAISVLVFAAAFVAVSCPVAIAKKNKWDPCSAKFTTSASVNNPACKPKNPPPVVEDGDEDNFSGGQNGGKGGTNSGKGHGGKGHGGGKGGGGKGGGGGRGRG